MVYEAEVVEAQDCESCLLGSSSLLIHPVCYGGRSRVVIRRLSVKEYTRVQFSSVTLMKSGKVFVDSNGRVVITAAALTKVILKEILALKLTGDSHGSEDRTTSQRNAASNR